MSALEADTGEVAPSSEYDQSRHPRGEDERAAPAPKRPRLQDLLAESDPESLLGEDTSDFEGDAPDRLIRGFDDGGANGGGGEGPR